MEKLFLPITLALVLLLSSFAVPAIANSSIATDTAAANESPITSQSENSLTSSPLIDQNQLVADRVLPSIDSPYSNELVTTTSQQPTAELPDNLMYWSDAVAIQQQFSYLQIDANAVIKYTADKHIEVTVKTTASGFTAQSIDTLRLYNAKIVKPYSTLHAYVVSLPEVNLSPFIDSLGTLPEIVYVEPTFYSQATFTPNDPEWLNQYGPQIIGMETAWDIQMGSIDVLVAIIDTGIDYTHPDLGNYLPIGYDFANNDDDPMDDHGHGTHVAGTIAASINNAVGVAGLANVSFFAEKFLDAGGYGSDVDAAAAIMHAVGQNADILSNSWGGAGESQVLADAIAYAINSSVIVVAAAGNDGSSGLFYPAAYPGVIAVGATDSTDEIASFSNHDSWVDISAPGVNILSTVPGGYAYFSGTSMAAPHVSGLLALLISEFPTYSPSSIENLLYSTAVDLGEPGKDDYYGWGRIDAGSAIFGLQEHNLRATINSPNVVPFNSTTIINSTVANLGSSNETDVHVTLYLNSSVVANVTIPFLDVGASYSVPFNLFSNEVAVYNFTFVVNAVVGENITFDNIAQKFIISTLPIINPVTGNQLAYGDPANTVPFDLRWDVIDASDPANVQMAWYAFDTEYRQEFLVGEFTLNSFTREISTIWDLFPYWINPNVNIGDSIELFQKGSYVPVINETTIAYYGEDIAVWVVDDGYELVYFSKADGVLLALADYNYTLYPYQMIYSDVIPSIGLHNLRVSFTGPISGVYNTVNTIEFFVQNTGLFTESTTAYLWVDGGDEFMTDFTLNTTGDYLYLSFDWLPTEIRQYGLNLSVIPTQDEFFINDNFDWALVNVIELFNYDVSNPAFDWLDAATNGYNLGLIGDDTFTAVDLGFTFSFYDGMFSTMYVSSNGWISFGETDPYEFWTDPFPTLDHPYAVAPFWNDLIADNNVYAWATSDFIVVEFQDYRYLWDEPVGTFEVVFYANGDIVFQYLSMYNDQSSVKGLNYGLNLQFYNSISADLSNVQNYAIKFSAPSSSTDILLTQLYVPTIDVGESAYIYASVTNVGTEPQYDVVLYLLINDVVKSAMYTQFLPAGENLSLVYYWQNVQVGTYNIVASAPPMPNEEVVDNNNAQQQIHVGQIHDLSVYLDIYLYGDTYIINAIITNLGNFDEHYVQVDIYIDGITVNSGFLSFIGAGTTSVLGYFWSNVPDGTYDVIAYVYPVADEDDTSNNVDSETLTVGQSNLVYTDIEVYDNVTGLPIANASLYIYNINTNEVYYGYTNSTGTWATDLPSGDYYLMVNASGYISSDLYFSIIDTTNYFSVFIYLTPISTNEFAIIYPATGDIISGGLVYVVFTANNMENLMSLAIYVNDIYISTVTPSDNDLVIPVFANGSNTIWIDAYWYDGSSVSTSLQIDSVDVVPLASLESGDFINFPIIVNDGSGTTQEMNFTVVGFVSQYEVYFNFTVHISDNNGTDELLQFYLIVNILNGYIVESDSGWQGMHFIFFSGITSPDMIQALDGVAVFFTWTDLYYLNNSTEWNGYDVWIATSTNNAVIYLLQSSGLLVYYNVDNLIIGEIRESSLLPTSTPVIMPVDDIFAEYGSNATYLIWTAYGDNSAFYDVYIDGDLYANGTWSSGVPISIYLPTFVLGVHSIEIYVVDQIGTVAMTSLHFTVNDTTPPILSSPTDIEFYEGTTNITLQWSATDYNPANYSIMVNGSLYDYGSLDRTITLYLDTFPAGNYLIECFVYDTSGNFAIDLVLVSVLPADNTPPTVIGTADFSYEEGSTKNTVSWTIADENPYTYELYLNDDLFQTGYINDTTVLSFNIDGLSANRYEFTLVIYDTFMNLSNDTIIVYVLAVDELTDYLDSPVNTMPFSAIFSIIALFSLGVFIRFSRHK